MKLSPWRANSCSVTHEIPSILWNLKVHYNVKMRSPLLPILSQMNPVHTRNSIYLTSILILYAHLWRGLRIFPSGSPTKIYMQRRLSHAYYMHCQFNPNWLDRFNYLGEEKKLWKLLIMQFPPALFGPHIPSTLYSNTVSLRFCLYVKNQEPTHKKLGKKLQFWALYFILYIFRQQERNQKFWSEWLQELHEYKLCLISSWMTFHLLLTELQIVFSYVEVGCSFLACLTTPSFANIVQRQMGGSLLNYKSEGI
jgi:hypothetical protein